LVEKEIFGEKNTKRSHALTLSHNFVAFLSKAAKKRRLSQVQAKKLAGKLSSVFSCTLFRKPLLHDCDDLYLLPPQKSCTCMFWWRRDTRSCRCIRKKIYQFIGSYFPPLHIAQNVLSV
jgi:hypothetical protein